MLTPVEISALILSLKVALLSTVISLPVAIAVAWLLARKSFPGKVLVDSIIHLPLVLPPVAVGYLLLLGLGRGGPLGGWLYNTFGISLAFTWVGAAIAAAIMGFPLMVRAIRLSIEAICIPQGLLTRLPCERTDLGPSGNPFSSRVCF